MHNASTKQRRAALRRRLGIWLGFSSRTPPKIRPQRNTSFLADIVQGLTPAPWRRPRPTPPPAMAIDLSSAPTIVEGAADATLVASRYIAVVDPTPPLAQLAPSPGDAPGEPAGGAAAASGQGRQDARVILVVAMAAVAVALVFAGAIALRRAPRDGGGPPASAHAVAQAEHAGPPGPAPTREATAPASGVVPPAPAPGAAADADLVEVETGDTLWALSARRYGDPLAWPRLFAQNRDRIADPDLIYPGQRLRLADQERR